MSVCQTWSVMSSSSASVPHNRGGRTPISVQFDDSGDFIVSIFIFSLLSQQIVVFYDCQTKTLIRGHLILD